MYGLVGAVVVVGLPVVVVAPTVVVTPRNVVVVEVVSFPFPVVLLALLPSCACVYSMNVMNIIYLMVDIIMKLLFYQNILSGIWFVVYYSNDITWTIPWVTNVSPPVTYSMPF
jgi:hypothetical protein